MKILFFPDVTVVPAEYPTNVFPNELISKEEPAFLPTIVELVPRPFPIVIELTHISLTK